MIFKYAALISLSIFKKELIFFKKIDVIKQWIDLLEKAVFWTTRDRLGELSLGEAAVWISPNSCWKSHITACESMWNRPLHETLQWENPEPTGNESNMKIAIYIYTFLYLYISDFYTHTFSFR